MTKKRPDQQDSAYFEKSFASWTDHYFFNTREIVKQQGDVSVCYAYFMRRPVRYCPMLALRFLKETLGEKVYREDILIEEVFQEGEWVGAGEPMLFITGSFDLLVMLETRFLQLLGPACVAAENAYNMCSTLPQTAFLAMEARHCVGNDMVSLMNYGASVGSKLAQRSPQKAKGFIGNATQATSHFFDKERSYGTMPHALIGYTGSTVRAAEMFYDTFPEEPLTVLIDYFGKEFTDALAVCHQFRDIAQKGYLSLRIDTTKGRFCEDLDRTKSYAILEMFCPDVIHSYRSEKELDHLVGTGVSAAAVWKMRQVLNENGFPMVKIVASGGFDPLKCQCFALAKAPIDVIGTGSYLPENWSETHATADIISYGTNFRVKIGREYLIKNYQNFKKDL